MKIVTLRTAAFVAVASIVALFGSVPSVEGRRSKDVDHKNAVFKADNHGNHHHHGNQHHGKNHKHHHDPKLHQKNPHDRAHQNVATIGLVCDGFLIDQIVCLVPSTGGPPGNCKQEQQDEDDFEALNNQRQNDGQKKIDRFVNMQLPCSPKLPETCMAKAEEEEEDEQGEDGDGETERVAADGDPQLESENNKHCHHKKNHHHHQDHSHHRKPKKNKHPYKDLCVATGAFCGSKLYGCDFMVDSLYTCASVGGKPILKQEKSPVCTGIEVTVGSCTCPDSAPVCGSDLPAGCRSDPNTIYYCPEGKGSRPHILRMCNPGSQCKATSQTTDPVCGFQNCNCTGTSTVCSNQFDDSCGLPKNTLIQCDASNKKAVVGECSSSQVCTTVGNQAYCAADDCKCSSDGVVCGEVFPLSCRISAVALYSCKAGKAPVITEKCSPGRCSGTIRDSAAQKSNSVFISQADDTCRDACQCTTDGDACARTFPQICDFDKNSLYDCSGPGATPSLISFCDSGCVVQADDDICAEIAKTCSCPQAGKVCGTHLPTVCKASPSALYSCSAIGAAPMLLHECPNGKCIVQTTQDDYCANACSCTTADPTCGFELTAPCKGIMDIDENSVYICRGGPGTKPELTHLCQPGTNCQKKASPVGATCGGNDCECKGMDQVCSSFFPDDCGVAKNTIFQCATDGAPTEVKTCAIGTSCITVSDGSTCMPSDCTCTRNGEVCGELFPLACKMQATAIYTCTMHGLPVLKSHCLPNRCDASIKDAVMSASSIFSEKADSCVDSCFCRTKGDVCGSTLPAKCNLAKDSLYHCDGPDVVPILSRKCLSGICVVSPGDDYCGNGDECRCQDGDSICGHAFLAACNKIIDTLYLCTGGAGSEPIPGPDCGSGNCLIKISDDACVETPADPCVCVDGTRPCGSTFPHSCGYDKDMLYRCPGGTGTKPTGGDECESGDCIVQNGDDACRPVPRPGPSDICSCRNDHDSCGSSFPVRCGYDNGAIYKCTAAGSTPTMIEKCTILPCVVQVDHNDICPPPALANCKCILNYDSCGSAYAPKCNFGKQTLYKCSGVGSDPVPISNCEAGCTLRKDIDDQCAPKVEDPCTCFDNSPPCGSNFPESCGYDNATLYQCSEGRGARPSNGVPCDSKVCRMAVGDDFCVPNECKCADDFDVCGAYLPARCNFLPDTLYKCSGAGADPQPFKECGGGCLEQRTNDICKEVNPCVCTDGTLTCGGVFDRSCNLDSRTLYACAGPGAHPVLSKKCGTLCLVEDGDDGCQAPPPADCTCRNAKQVCGSVWNSDCNYGRDTLYTCAAEGTVPIKTEVCDLGCFIHLDLNDECKRPNRCLCQDNYNSCGFEFPTECGFPNNTLYSCSKNSNVPTPFVECKEFCQENLYDDECYISLKDPCLCTDSTAPCGSQFPPVCGFDNNTLYQCPGGEGTPPVQPQACKLGCGYIPVLDDECKNPTCTCEGSTSVCGSTFDKGCGFAINTLYTCSGKDATPAFSEMCKSACVRVAGSNDVCLVLTESFIDPCKCVDGTDACGSSFGKDCIYDRNTLYKCPGGKGTLPVQPELCTFGKCLIEPGDDVCQGPPPSDCKCQDDSLICGSLFDANCSLNGDTLYTCLGGNGTDPKPTEICTQGCFIHAVGNDECKPPPSVDPCKCKSNNTACGFTFVNCGYNPNTLHLCTGGKGSIPIPDRNCPHMCLREHGPDMCQDPPPTDCLCQGGLDICGKTFPTYCNFPNDTLFMCPNGANSQPVVKTDCQHGCDIRATVSDECELSDDCKCKTAMDTCGNAFPPSCNRTKSTLYHCPGGPGADPEDSELCTYGGCIIQPTRNDICQPKPPPDCNCPMNSPVCGSIFLPECGKEPQTLYTCEAAGSPPVATENCTLGCQIVDKAADKCKKPDCTCTESGRFCGSSLKPNCNYVPNTIYDCTKGPGTDPVPQQICLPGTLCLLGSLGPACGGTDCNCTGTQTVCSDMFPASCGLRKNSLYKCTPSGRPVLQNACDTGKKCVQVSDGGSCGDCTCPSTGLVCGSAFPKSCSFYSWRLYTCTKGETPIPGQQCFPNHCFTTVATISAASVGPASDIFKATADDVCIDGCKCSASGKMCGNTFPASCGFGNNTLMGCSGAGSTPTNSEMCQSGCAVTPSDDHCIGDDPPPPDCYCDDATPMCGTEIEEECSVLLGAPVDKNTIYTCSGEGQIPQPGEKCRNDYFCADAPDPTGAVCKPLCNCTGTETACSKTFDPICNLPPQALYKCNSTGQPEPVEVCTGAAICANAPNPICTLRECLCNSTQPICGSSFPKTCNMENNALYPCPAAGSLPTDPVTCDPGVCSATILAANGNKALPTDQCIDQCNCKQVGPICAARFDPTCNYNNGTLMNCGTVGAKPTVTENCTIYCDEKPVGTTPDECVPDPCSCAKNGDTCGSTFPPQCGIESNIIVKCAGKNLLPTTPGTPCAADERCVPVQGGDDICGPSNSCDCVGNGTICADLLQPVCNSAKPRNTFIVCPAGVATTCPNGCAGGQCKSDCKCTESGVKCGSSFARKCGLLPNTLYTCTVGNNPIVKGACDDKACVKGTLDDTCANPCKCKGNNLVCGASFPKSCGFDIGTLYTCSAVGQSPVVSKACTKGCKYTLPDNSCKFDCDAPSAAVTDQLTKILNDTSSASDLLTQLAYPPLVPVINQAVADIKANVDNPTGLAQAAGSLKNTTVGVISVFTRIEEISTANTGATLITDLQSILPLVTALTQCAGIGGDCSGPKRIFSDYMTSGLAKIQSMIVPPLNATKMNDIIAQATKASNAIRDSIDQMNSTLIEAALTNLNRLIGTTGLDHNTYGEAVIPMELILAAANAWLTCEGFQPLPYCTAYTVQLESGVTGLIKIVTDNFALISPIAQGLRLPVTRNLTKVLTDLQTNATNSLNNAASALLGLEQIFDLLDQTPKVLEFQGYIRNLIQISNYLKPCGGANPICYSFIGIISDMGIRGINAFNIYRSGDPEDPIDDALDSMYPLIQGVADAVQFKSIAAIRQALDAFTPHLSVVLAISGAEMTAPTINMYRDDITSMMNCLDKEGVRPKT